MDILLQAVIGTAIIAINALLVIEIFKQRARNAKMQHEISQTLLTLRQASRVLKDSTEARENAI